MREQLLGSKEHYNQLISMVSQETISARMRLSIVDEFTTHLSLITKILEIVECLLSN